MRSCDNGGLQRAIAIVLAFATACATGVGDDTAATSASTTTTGTIGTMGATTGLPTTGAPGSDTTFESTTTNTGTTGIVDPTTSAADTAASTGGPEGCAPVTSQTFTLAQDVPLTCGADTAIDVFDELVVPRGPAAARATVIVEHTKIVPEIHFWNATVVVGDAQYAFGIGDDICNGYQPVTKTNLGYGRLTDASPRVRVPMYQGSAPCTDGALVVRAGSTLELWYEGDDPACEGKSITYTSWYATQGFQTTYVWQTTMAEILALPIDIPADREALLLSVVEGSPDMNPNATCGNETQTLVSQLVVDAAIVHQAEMLLPASAGQGHLVLANQATATGDGPHAAQLLVGANVFNSAVRTGGCCGDAALMSILVAP